MGLIKAPVHGGCRPGSSIFSAYIVFQRFYLQKIYGNNDSVPSMSFGMLGWVLFFLKFLLLTAIEPKERRCRGVCFS
jgi:hypothetical protein